jgi:neutral ceramidase
VGGLEQEYTTYACFGMAFLEGTTDGRGAPRALGAVLDMLFHSGKQVEILAAKLSKNPRRKEAVLRFHNAQHPKTVVMNLSKGGVMATDKIERLALPDFVDPTIKYLKHAYRSQSIQTPWVPERMPLQIFIIGNLALIGIPSEITTIAGERLRNTLRPILAQRGVEHIQLCPYANSYGGYITTYEEYRTQSYEGGHTLYGKWTLAAYQQCFSQVAEELLKAPEERQALGVEPLVFPIEEIWKGFDDPKIRVY